MEQKNRLFIAIAVTVLITAAMFTSFGRSLFATHIPSVVLPDGTASSSQAPGSSSEDPFGQYIRVAVTPETVQAVIASLTRSDSYYRELTVETFWPGGSSQSSVQVWTDGGWSHIQQIRPSGVIRHDLVGDDTVYYWYNDAPQYQTCPADQQSADLAQRVPTYETVLALDQDAITAADYEIRGELPCIYVEVEQRELGYLQRYWISTDSGLLISAEAEKGGELIYRMTAYAPIQTCPATASFALPDGTVLHTM